MRILKKNPVIIVLGILNLFFLLMLTGRYLYDLYAKRVALAKLIDKTATAMDKAGIQPREQSLEVSRIAHSVERSGGSISDRDLDYMFAILERKYSSPEEHRRRSMEKVRVCYSLQMALRQLTPKQQQAVYEVFLRSAQEPLDGYAASASLVTSGVVLSRLHDQRLVPHALRLIQNPNKDVQRIGRKCLQNLGFGEQGATATNLGGNHELKTGR